MLLISIDYGRSPLSIYVFPILLQQKLIELLRSPIYHIKSGRRSNLAVGCHIKKIAIATGITLRAMGRHIKPEFLEILNWTASWPIGDLVSPRWFKTHSESLTGQRFFGWGLFMELFDVDGKGIMQTPIQERSDADTIIIGLDAHLQIVAESPGLGYCRRASTWDLKDMNISTIFDWISIGVEITK